MLQTLDRRGDSAGDHRGRLQGRRRQHDGSFIGQKLHRSYARCAVDAHVRNFIEPPANMAVGHIDVEPQTARFKA